MKAYYERNGITIYHGDAMELLAALPDGAAQCAVTSPPYNLLKTWGHSQGPNTIHKAFSAKMLTDMYPDSLPEPRYQGEQRAMVEQLLRVTDGSVFYNHKIRYSMKRMKRAVHPMEWLAGLPLWCEIVWDRGGGIGHNAKRWVHSDERIYQFNRPKVWRPLGYTTVWRIVVRPWDIAHPCPFPVDLPARCIASTTEAGHVVIDPYLGSGTTLLAAARLGRGGIGFEREERWCELSAKRIEAAQQGVQEPFEFAEASS